MPEGSQDILHPLVSSSLSRLLVCNCLMLILICIFVVITIEQ